MIKYICLVCIVQLTFGQSVEGYWKTVDEEGVEKSIIKIYKTNDGTLEGVVYKILDPNKQNELCVKCKGKNKNKPIKGLKIIKNMKFDKDEWKDGEITDPNNGKTYNCKIWLNENEPNVLNVRGYVGFFYRTQYWKKVKKP